MECVRTEQQGTYGYFSVAYLEKQSVLLHFKWCSGKNQRVGLYYVNANGVRVKNTWKGSRYYGSTGKAVSGLQTIGGVYYYFNTKTYEKVTNTTVKTGGVTYVF